VRVPALEDECGLEAAQLLAQLTGGGRRLEARIETRVPATGKRHAPNSAPTMTVSMRDPEDKELSISARMLRAGLARLSGKTHAATDMLRPHVEEARAARLGIFEFGDPDDSDDERFPTTGRVRARV
jgi:staphylococcal nuclease domain-containing protein 1